MSAPLDGPSKELPGTYIVQDRQNKDEFARLDIQDQLFRRALGGVLPEQADLKNIRYVLDIGCGTGGWLIEAAECYPQLSLTGVDISRGMIEYATAQAREHQVADHITFHKMDALSLYGFPAASFDLANVGFACSFLRTWDWRDLLKKLLYVVRPGGVIRLCDTEIVQPSSSPALTEFCEMLQCALYRAGHLFEETSTGLTTHLAPLLTQHGCQQVQTRSTVLTVQAGTPEWEAFFEDVRYLFRTLRPFIQKWGCLSRAYDQVCQQALVQMQDPDFHATWNFLTAWGRVPNVGR